MSIITYNYIEKLFRNHYEKLYYLAYNMVHDDEVSRDIVCDAFLKIINRREQIEESNIMGYLYIIIRNLCYDYNDKQTKSEKYQNYILTTSIEEETYEWFEKEQRLQEIDRIVDTLPERTQFVLDQCYFQGHTYREVGAMLNISESAVKKHIMKAFSILREHFNVSKQKK